MAGVKARKGQTVSHQRYYAKGQEWRPARAVTRKMFGNGYKDIMAAQSVQTGELYKTPAGRVAPWQSIPFTSIKPEGLE